MSWNLYPLLGCLNQQKKKWKQDKVKPALRIFQAAIIRFGLVVVGYRTGFVPC
jgi:hypothetical protein